MRYIPIFLMLAIMDGRKGVRECWPFGLFVGVVFDRNRAGLFDQHRLQQAEAAVFIVQWQLAGGTLASGSRTQEGLQGVV